MKGKYNIIYNEKFILLFYTLTSLVTAIDRYLHGPKKYNNFQIFKASLFHLLNHQNLHLEYPHEYFDLFLYNPSFCIIFAPFSLLPTPVGLAVWLIFSSTAVFYAVKLLPVNHQQKVFFWWFIWFELLKAIHSQQTNPILAACGLCTFVLLEKGRVRWAALLPVLSFCIKGYGLAFAALFLFYPGKKQFFLYSLLWGALLILLPLPFVGWAHFVTAYQDWFALLVQDHKDNFGHSIMGVLKTCFPAMTIADSERIQLLGLALMVGTWVQLLISKKYICFNTRLLALAYLCLWVILFNHSAEGPTYIIAACGVSLFYIADQHLLKPWSALLAGLAWIGSIFARMNIYPGQWSESHFHPFLIKVIPYFLVWFVLQIQLLYRYEK